MCGLILSKHAKADQMAAAMSAMSYRGKDGKAGLVYRAGWNLGHVRLAIQDLTDYSSQPINAQDFSLAYVGEIFNTDGQNELHLVAQTYDDLGPAGFHQFDGFWAIAAVHDNGSVTVFNDYLGQKPIYYWEDEQIVCSELDPMFQIQKKPAFDEVYLANVIKFGYDYSGRTPYEGIRQLAPGHLLKITNFGEMIVYPYWDWYKVPVPKDLHAALTKATLARLVGERPVALLLSGGLDSTIIYSILKKAGKEVRSFSIENGESGFLPEDIEYFDPNIGDYLVDALAAMQCPVDLGSMVPQYILGAELKKKGFNVCMSGDGADELFGGYRRAEEYDSQASDTFCELPYYHLPRLDRLMMRHTVELRSPYLAPYIVAYALSLPYEKRTKKQALKEAFALDISYNILERKKLALKTPAVVEGGIQYRKQLVEIFKC